MHRCWVWKQEGSADKCHVELQAPQGLVFNMGHEPVFQVQLPWRLQVFTPGIEVLVSALPVILYSHTN